MMKKPLYAVLAGYLVTSIFTPAVATTTPRLTPEVGNYGVVWRDKGITIEYSPGCNIDDGKWLPEAYCGQDRLSIKTELEVNDQSSGSVHNSRPARFEDMTVWVDGEKVPGTRDWQYGRRLEDALKDSADKRMRIAVPETVGGWGSTFGAKQEYHYFEVVLADYDTVTSKHRQEVRQALSGVAQERQRTRILISLVVLAVILAILSKLIPASIRAFRSAKIAAYEKAHHARESVSKATYDYRVNREVERLRLKEEAEKRRGVERQKEALSEQLQEALENEDHEKAQDILKQLADLKKKKAPVDNRGAEGSKE